MSNWVFYVLGLLLVLIGYLGFHSFQAIQYARLETDTKTVVESATESISAKGESVGSEESLNGHRRIWARNLFNLVQVRDSEPPEKISLAKKDLGLELVGTVVSDNPQMSRAIFDNPKIRKKEAYREGGSAGEVLIKKICATMR